MPRHDCYRGLPQHGWSLTVWWCAHHQAYSAAAHGFQQIAGDRAEFSTALSEVEFGPFDTIADVQAWIRSEWNGWHRALDENGARPRPE